MTRTAVATAAVVVLLQGLTTVVTGFPTSTHSTNPAQRSAAIRALLAVREKAVVTGDRTAWMSSVDRADRTFADHEEQVFRSARRLPLATWHYTFSGATAITLHTRLAGYDSVDQLTTEHLSFTPGEHPEISADRSQVRPWDLGETAVTRGVRTLVLSAAADVPLARQVAAVEDDAILRVSDAWGTGWGQKAVIELSHTYAESTALAGRSMTNIAALTILQHDRSVGVGRIVINPAEFTGASLQQRQILLRHETTHLATQDQTTGATPTWLVEGYADLIGFQHVPPKVGAPDLEDAVLHDRLPKHLPTDHDYEPVGGTATAYSEGWLACRMLGDVKASALYRAIAAGASLQDALVHVTGAGTEAFTQAFIAYVKAQLS